MIVGTAIAPAHAAAQPARIGLGCAFSASPSPGLPEAYGSQPASIGPLTRDSAPAATAIQSAASVPATADSAATRIIRSSSSAVPP